MNALFHRQTDVGLQETEGGIHGDRSGGHRLRRRSSRIESRSREIHQRRIRLDINCYFAFIVVHIGQYRPLVGSSFIPTPASLMAKHVLINDYNPNDSMCFVWAVLSALYPCKKNAERVSKYRPYLNSIDLTGLNYPVPVNRVARFEKNNPTISINVYALGKDEQEIIPKFVTKCGAREKHVDLLLLSSKTDDNFHYTWIKNMSALICHRTKYRGVMHVCPHCVHRLRRRGQLRTIYPIFLNTYIKGRYTPNRDQTKASWNGNRARRRSACLSSFTRTSNRAWSPYTAIPAS
jgi:hypothetical protein